MTRRMGVGGRTTRWGALGALTLALLATGPSFADPPKSNPPKDDSCVLLSPQEASFRFAYGIGDEESLRWYAFGPRVAYDLPSFVPAILGNRIRIAIEAMGSIVTADHRGVQGEFALSPLIFDYRYDSGGAFVPFLEGGEGIVLTTLRDLRIGGPFEFSSQAGGGVHLFFTTEDALTLGARYRHISNAGIKDENHGLNTFFITIGLSHFPNRQ